MSSFYFAGRCISLIHHSMRLVIRRDAGSSPKLKNAYDFYSSRRKQLLYVIILRDRGLISTLTLVSRVLSISINTFNNMDLDPWHQCKQRLKIRIQRETIQTLPVFYWTFISFAQNRWYSQVCIHAWPCVRFFTTFFSFVLLNNL